MKFAYSEIRTLNIRYFAFRELSRTSVNPWDSTRVVYGTKGKKCGLSYIPRGEDPRLFFYKQQPWIYFQIYNEKKGDVEIRIRNLVSNIEYQLLSPLGFNGKNWIPFEKDNNLFFIYSLEPLVILKLAFNAQSFLKLEMVCSPKDFSPSWETDFTNSIGRVRGGTPSAQIDKNIFGFTHDVHAPPNYQFHTLGCFILDPVTHTVGFKSLSELVPGFLIDPYGVVLFRKKIRLYCSIVAGDLHGSNSDVANVIISFRFKYFKSWINNFASKRLT